MLTHTLGSSISLSQKRSSFWEDLLLVCLGSFLIVLCAPLSIKLPFTPIPIVLTSHLCLALGALLGSRRGALAVLTYLFQGAMGLPVFALGASGWLHLLGPRGGYLLGWVAAAYVTGYLMENMREKTAWKTFLSLVAGNGIIYLFGIPQLSLFMGFKSALLLGMLPFLIGDAFKLLAVYKGIKWIKRTP
jgi:biotin transport system substrate-specific component